nr:uncharacterized protein LOC112295779 isoform X3 [Physcomitrium patens]|eukprot:XP_024403492.1 uncharacterized protein LOC112295779 isoform X3 [Physcomitrella patens]
MDENSTQLTYWQAAKDDDCEPPVEFVVEMKPNVVITPGTDSRMTASAEIESFSGRNEASESTLVALLPVYSPKMSLKGDTKPLSATPIAVTPCQPASVGNPRARHRRASSVGNLTPGVPFDMSAESSPFGDYVCSPSSQSSSAKSKLTSRGYKEVTPRMNLPKPSWKAIVEREMKGSKLKALLAAQLPKETSPFSEYLEIQMENQSRNAVSGTIWSTEKNVNLTRSPAKRECRVSN